MPWKYLVEFICDGVGAGKAYSGANWNQSSPLEYWNRKDHKSIYHDTTRAKVEFYYTQIAKHGWNYVAARIKQEGDYFCNEQVLA